MIKWTEEEDAVLKSNCGIRNKELKKLLNRSVTAIKTRRHTLNLKRPTRPGNNIYYVNKDYFTELTPENCYWMGFIAADGYIANPSSIKIELSYKDHWHLEHFAYMCHYTGPIHVYERECSLNNYNWRCKSSHLVIGKAPEWVTLLNTHANITPRKSLTLQPPNFDDEDLCLSYIAGYIDGDGCITTNDNGLRLKILGTKEFLTFIKDWFDLLVPSPQKHNISDVRTRGKIFCYYITKNRVIQLYKKLSKLNLPLLERKWNKVSSII